MANDNGLLVFDHITGEVRHSSVDAEFRRAYEQVTRYRDAVEKAYRILSNLSNQPTDADRQWALDAREILRAAVASPRKDETK